LKFLLSCGRRAGLREGAELKNKKIFFLTVLKMKKSFKKLLKKNQKDMQKEVIGMMVLLGQKKVMIHGNHIF